MKDRIEAARVKASAILTDLPDGDIDLLIAAYQMAIKAADVYAKAVSAAVCRVKANKKRKGAK